MLSVLFAILSGLATGPSSDAVDQARKRALDDVQTSIPDLAPKQGRMVLRRYQRHRKPREVPGALGGFANILLWLLVFVGAGVIAFWIATELSDRSAAAGDVDDDPMTRGPPSEAVIQRPLGDANALAAEKRYAEAIHTLLLRTFDELRRLSPAYVSPSLTSRELLVQLPLGNDARRELHGLVTAVELSHFGGHEVGDADFQLCLSHFQRFADAYRGAA